MDREPAKRFEELVVWQKAHRRRGNQRQRCPVANQPSSAPSARSAVAVFDSCLLSPAS